MPLHETDAFVLRTYTLKEADKVCVFFTREAGKVRGVAHGARRLRSKYGASLEPFTEVALTYFQKENKELVSVSNCEIVRSQFTDGLSSELLGVIHYLAELVGEFTPDQEPNEKVYRLISATLEALQEVSIGTKKEREAQLSKLIRYFEIWMLKLAGFFPDWQHCGRCHKDLKRESSVRLTNEGIPHCTSCSRMPGEELSAKEWRIIQAVLTQSPARFLSSSPDTMAVEQIGFLASRLISRVLERELKSYEVLERLKL